MSDNSQHRATFVPITPVKYEMRVTMISDTAFEIERLLHDLHINERRAIKRLTGWDKPDERIDAAVIVTALQSLLKVLKER